MPGPGPPVGGRLLTLIIPVMIDAFPGPWMVRFMGKQVVLILAGGRTDGRTDGQTDGRMLKGEKKLGPKKTVLPIFVNVRQTSGTCV